MGFHFCIKRFQVLSKSHQLPAISSQLTTKSTNLKPSNITTTRVTNYLIMARLIIISVVIAALVYASMAMPPGDNRANLQIAARDVQKDPRLFWPSLDSLFRPLPWIPLPWLITKPTTPASNGNGDENGNGNDGNGNGNGSNGNGNGSNGNGNESNGNDNGQEEEV